MAAFTGVALIESPGQAKTDSPEPEKYEFKIMLQNSPFTRVERHEAIGQFIDFINTTPGVTLEEKTKEKKRITSYIDTENCDLLKNNYILRKRFDLKNNLPYNLAITLKFRDVDRTTAASKAYQAHPSKRMRKSKYEADITINASSERRMNHSYSASIELGKIKTISDLEKLYPVIKQAEISKSKSLIKVNGFTAFETAIELGTIKIMNQKCKASINFWHKTRDEKQLMLSEFSYKCKQFSADAKRLHSAIAKNPDWAARAATLKTSFAYGDFCGID